MSSYRSRGIVAIGVVMASLAAFVIAYAAQVSTPETNSGGQGVTVTEGYTAGTVSYSGDWAATTSNNTSTNVTTASFSLEQTNGALVTSAETTVYAQLTGGTSSNWTLCTIPTAGNVTCDFTSASKPISSITGIDIVAQGDALPAANPPDEPEAAAALTQFVASDGGLDTSFDPGAGPTNDYGLLLGGIQPDGKILVNSSTLTSYDGNPVSQFARLNTDGSLDTSFDTDGKVAGHFVAQIAPQSNGKILVRSSTSSGTYDGDEIGGYIYRLNSDGSLDTSFDLGAGPNYSFYNMYIQSDDKILVAGFFSEIDGISRIGFARLNSDGSLDTSFDPGAGLGQRSCTPSSGSGSGSSSSSVSCPSPPWSNFPNVVGQQPDGKILIDEYSMTSYDGTPVRKLARINSDGSLDTTFDAGTGPNFSVVSASTQSDGKILISGNFTSYNGTAINRIARLNSDGSLDNSFEPPTEFTSGVKSVLQPDGKIVISGSFTTIDGIARNRIARLNSDGSLDTSFDPGAGPNDYLTGMLLQDDGKIVISGGFTSYDGVARNKIARIGLRFDAPSSADPLGEAFTVLTLDAADGTALAVGVSPDGGELLAWANSSPTRVVRYNQPALDGRGVLTLQGGS